MKRGRIWFAAAAVFGVLAAVFRFAMTGYIISAMCCVFAAAVCVFFGLMRRWASPAALVLTILMREALAVLLVLFLAAEIPVVRDMRPREEATADYAIVFGAGVNGREPSLSLEERLEAALAWLEENPQGVAIVSGCRGNGEAISEAQCMYEWLTARGVSSERVIREEQAGSSYENLVYSLAVIRELGGDPAGRVALVSSEYHLHRLRLVAEALGCEPVLVAAHTERLSLAVNYAVREAFAMWRIWILGVGPVS